MPARLFDPIRSRDAEAGWTTLPRQQPPSASASILLVAIIAAALAFWLTGPVPEDAEQQPLSVRASAAQQVAYVAAGHSSK